MTRRATQKRQTRARVLESARLCFRELGYDATTIARVAKRAQVAAGTVISHFPDKASLVAAAFHAELSDRVREAFTTLPQGDALASLLHVARTLYRWYADDPVLASHLLQQTLFLEGAMGDELQTQLQSFVVEVERTLASSMPDAPPDARMLASQGFFVDYFGVLVRHLRLARATGEPFDLPEAERQLWALSRARLRGLGMLPDDAALTPPG
ncbi:MAG: TetR/AcrR family transcriptional regulator [Myxococcales bacterium]|nr:TetR/AcrR family transcriptional regulator [Myxococcales bacterium]